MWQSGIRKWIEYNNELKHTGIGTHDLSTLSFHLQITRVLDIKKNKQIHGYGMVQSSWLEAPPAMLPCLVIHNTIARVALQHLLHSSIDLRYGFEFE